MHHVGHFTVILYEADFLPDNLPVFGHSIRTSRFRTGYRNRRKLVLHHLFVSRVRVDQRADDRRRIYLLPLCMILLSVFVLFVLLLDLFQLHAMEWLLKNRAVHARIRVTALLHFHYVLVTDGFVWFPRIRQLFRLRRRELLTRRTILLQIFLILLFYVRKERRRLRPLLRTFHRYGDLWRDVLLHQDCLKALVVRYETVSDLRGQLIRTRPANTLLHWHDVLLAVLL